MTAVTMHHFSGLSAPFVRSKGTVSGGVFTAKGGIFGVEKADWVAELEKQNPLKAAEMSLEDDYGMIDGIINNGPKEDKANEKGGKTSIMDRLKSAKTAQQTDKPSPHKEKKSEREI